MNAWTIYWVMQLDSINTCLVGGCVILMIVTLFLAACVADGDLNPLFPTASAFLFGICFLGCMFVPSTKTAATMVILPAIANNEQIKKEAGDLYGLAKQALTKLAAPDEKSK